MPPTTSKKPADAPSQKTADARLQSLLQEIEALAPMLSPAALDSAATRLGDLASQQKATRNAQKTRKDAPPSARPLNARERLSAAQRAHLREIFDALDTDGSDELDYTEVCAAGPWAARSHLHSVRGC
jgi:hypothetical protein